MTKTYERHPLSAKYPDIKGRAWEDFVANLKRKGHGNRQIVLYEGKILDGWQLYRGCLECGIEPIFVKLPSNEDALEFVETKNDMRRHESLEVCHKRADERRERAALGRTSGKSLRTIADEEGVSEITIRRDLATSGATPVAPEPENGKISGKDGKCYNSDKVTRTTPKLTESGKVPMLCPACERRQRVGQSPLGKCPDCAVLRPKKATTAKAAPKSKAGKVVHDDRPIDQAIGKLIRLIDVRGNVLGKTKFYHEIVAAMGTVATLWKRWQKESAS